MRLYVNIYPTVMFPSHNIFFNLRNFPQLYSTLPSTSWRRMCFSPFLRWTYFSFTRPHILADHIYPHFYLKLIVLLYSHTLHCFKAEKKFADVCSFCAGRPCVRLALSSSLAMYVCVCV